MVIGRTSPVTYQVLGHLKTCLVLGLGYVLLANPVSWRNILGILVAMGGMFMYSFVQIQEGKAGQSAAKVGKDPSSHLLTNQIRGVLIIMCMYIMHSVSIHI